MDSAAVDGVQGLSGQAVAVGAKDVDGWTAPGQIMGMSMRVRRHR